MKRDVCYLIFMFKRLLILLALIAIAAVGLGAWQLQNPDSFLRQYLAEFTDKLPTLPALQLPKAEVSTPGPLRGRTDTPAQTLTVAGALAETNRHRTEAGLPALAANAKLAAAAQAKVNDMLEQQYFDHIGPDGRGPADWVEDAGYAYIAVGENLALGNFAGDAALVNAWMASPGHRANLLNRNFLEIGIAVGQGTFEGEKTWLAVQTFGTPASACPGPSATLHQQFEQKKALAAQIEQELARTRATLDQLVAEYEEARREHDEDRMRELEAQIKEREAAYNSFVEQYNALNNELIDLANKLNTQINQYNSCLAKFGS